MEGTEDKESSSRGGMNRCGNQRAVMGVSLVKGETAYAATTRLDMLRPACSGHQRHPGCIGLRDLRHGCAAGPATFPDAGNVPDFACERLGGADDW